MFRILKDFKELKRFNSLPENLREIVFYAETKADWAHFAPIVRELTERDGKTIAYVTSDATDSVLLNENSKIIPFCIGAGAACTTWFRTLKAKICVITLTDLETYHLKRSMVAPVHYVYVFHSLMSTHKAFRKKAHHAYDTILCSGPHHKDEIQKAEKFHGLRQKNLIEHGYGRLDAIIEGKKSLARSPENSKAVLIAPSYGPGSISETCVAELIESLLDSKHEVIYRPHPMTLRRLPSHTKKLAARFSSSERFSIEVDVRSMESLYQSDIMFSDWSGAALEYSFGLEKPVIFINTPPKIMNPDYQELNMEPLETFIRSQIGHVLELNEVSKAGEVVTKICKNPEIKKEHIQAAREKWIYNLGRSGRVGADAILNISQSLGNAGL
jgi:hypothetical protein